MEEYITSEELKRLRSRLGVTQVEFAELINSSKSTVERWERDKKGKITGPIVPLVRILENRPNLAERYMIVPDKKTPLRLWYMHNNKRCTMIDVDDSKQFVKIKNYTDDIMFRAFGINEEPTYLDYLEFLESRCFPRTRDKIKIILDELQIPFYDPFLIIKKTEGRMAEDDFWISIEE
ncbi:putative transcriptional regulator [Pseudobutyrivibrio ruminis]|uniref:Putative transcriptional regulator n=1 Tax=Pseudobutyrivibrio ruminis TaxID=46206 RepID=A0A1H7L963_9FIRM|nr:helix-turn-helix domain-containing protein [Pseudobutyrivibrio ruminis]SEK95509.1 putative transcriptional regulator [Pseudobutyrivibrio ruminis]